MRQLIIKETKLNTLLKYIILYTKTVLNSAKDYYQINKVLREKGKNKYRALSEEEKNIKTEYGRNRYKSVWRRETKTEGVSKNLLRSE